MNIFGRLRKLKHNGIRKMHRSKSSGGLSAEQIENLSIFSIEIDSSVFTPKKKQVLVRLQMTIRRQKQNWGMDSGVSECSKKSDSAGPANKKQLL